MKDTKQKISYFLLLNFIIITFSLWSKCFPLTIHVKPLQNKFEVFREFLFFRAYGFHQE